MVGTRGARGVDSTVSRQHVQIEALVEALHRRFESGSKVSRNLVSLLNSLAAHLETHFELEEEGGYFAGVVQRSPHLSNRAEVMLKQHEKLLEESYGLVTVARGAFSNDVEAPGLAESFEQFRLELLSHEQAEIDLLQEAYTRDLGNKD